MKNLLLLNATILLLAIGVSFAQEEPGPEVAAHEGRTIRFYCMGDSMPRYFYDVRKNETTEIGSACGTLSLSHPMPSNRLLEIYRQILPPPNAPAGTKPLKEILATTTIPAGFSKAIVLLFPDGEKLRVAAFGDSYTLHPKGKVRVFNLSPLEISLQVGSTTNRFKPGQEGIMPWSGKSDVVVFQTCFRKGDAWQIVGINELATRPNLRAFMFAFKGIPEINSTVCFDAVPDDE